MSRDLSSAMCSGGLRIFQPTNKLWRWNFALKNMLHYGLVCSGELSVVVFRKKDCEIFRKYYVQRPLIGNVLWRVTLISAE